MISEFLALYSEFKTLEEVKVRGALTQAASFTHPGWKDKQVQGTYLAAAHILTVRWKQIGAIAANAVVQAKGSNSADNITCDSWFTTTVYGQQYLQLKRSIPVAGFVV